MRYSSIGSFFALALASGVAYSAPAARAIDERALLDFVSEKRDPSGRIGTGVPREVVSRLRRLDLHVEPLINQNPDAAGSLSGYETYVPDTSVQQLPLIERALLNAYLSDPSDAALAKTLAAYHVRESRGAAHGTTAAQLKHAIYASYFLDRAVDLGARDRWVTGALSETVARLNRIVKPELTPIVKEGLPSHLYFTETFAYYEGDRRVAVNELLREFIRQPNNVVTATYLAPSNIWVGGESAYNDATMLYSFLLSSYFAVRAIQMAQVVEDAWLADPVRNPQFRMGSLLGGWAVPARRWLAVFHGDTEAVSALDEEHRQWLAINPAFHSVPVGLMLFDEPENVAEGFGAYMQGFEQCWEVPGMRECLDRPKTSFNRLGFILGATDFALKTGQLDMARNLLMARWDPSADYGYESWRLGREGWEHRESNLEAIAALYGNGDPSDDPTNFLLKSHKWGPNTIVCQVCHNAQDRVWSEDDVERYRYEPAPSEVAVVGDWPGIATTWYGASLPAPSP